MNEIVQYVAFCDWFLSLSIMFLKFLYDATYSSMSFLLWLNSIPSYSIIPLFIHLSVQFSCPVMSNSLRSHGSLACQASLSITNSPSLLKLMSIESMMPSNHLILCRPLLFLPSIFPSIRVFFNESVLCIRWASVSPSVLPMNIQDWFPLVLTALILLQSKGLSRVFSNTQFKSINSLVLSLLYGPTVTFIQDYWKNHSFD